MGLALSDPTARLASPWKTVPAPATPGAVAARIAELILEVADPLDDAAGIGEVVVGLPRRLDGSDTSETQHARALAAAVHQKTGLPVHLQDERLTSRDAEARLAEREPDWRRRKARLDAAAAAIILQDFLDARPGPARDVAQTESW
jgi:putative Holliday junction resolvase